MSWRDRLERMLRKQPSEGKKRPNKENVMQFLRDTVAPALESVAEELGRHGRDAEVTIGAETVSITVYEDDEEEFFYAVKARTFRKPMFAFPEMTFKQDDGDTDHRAIVYTQEGAREYGIMGYDKERVIANFMHEYDRQLRWQKPTKGGS